MAGKIKSVLQDICFLVLILVFAAYAQINQSHEVSRINDQQASGIVQYENR